MRSKKEAGTGLRRRKRIGCTGDGVSCDNDSMEECRRSQSVTDVDIGLANKRIMLREITGEENSQDEQTDNDDRMEDSAEEARKTWELGKQLGFKAGLSNDHAIEVLEANILRD